MFSKSPKIFPSVLEALVDFRESAAGTPVGRPLSTGVPATWGAGGGQPGPGPCYNPSKAYAPLLDKHNFSQTKL